MSDPKPGLDFSGLPSIVTSSVCLLCRGCCRFQASGGDWAPRLTADDFGLLTHQVHDRPWRSGFDRILLKEGSDGCLSCSLLNQQDHHCAFYAARPLECRLYPLLLSREEAGFKIYAHLSCPAVISLKRSGGWEAYKASVQEYFRRKEVQSFIEQECASYPDYSLSLDQMEEVVAFDPAAYLWQMRARVEAGLAVSCQGLSMKSFAGLFAWKDFFDFSCHEFDGNLCVAASAPVGVFMYWPPLGSLTAKAVDAAFDYMRQENKGGSLTRIECVDERELKFFDPLKYKAVCRGKEYIYARRDLAQLSGGAFKSKRGDVNLFERSYAYEFRPYNDGDFNACAALYERWAKSRAAHSSDEAYRFMLEDNKSVHRVLLFHAARLGLLGRVVFVGDELVAYTFGCRLTPDTFCVLVEVADVRFKGLPAFVFSRFCADEALADVDWINAMDDMSFDDLARAKLSWRPKELKSFYAVILKE